MWATVESIINSSSDGESDATSASESEDDTESEGTSEHDVDHDEDEYESANDQLYNGSSLSTSELNNILLAMHQKHNFPSSAMDSILKLF